MDDRKKDQNEGITAISVQGFKSIAVESRIEVCPLTILAGANSSGKSSIMQPLLLMKQTLEASYDPGPLLLNGPNAKFTSANQFISRLQKNSASQSFSIGMEHAKGRTLKVELQVGRLPEAEPNGADLVNIADVGFGVSQVLPVLVALLVAESGQLVYIEQPELHLHPRAQYELAKILADAAKRGVRLVVETHSSLLLLMIQTLMAKGDLEPDLVKLHWFSRNPEDGTTAIQSADLDENGAFGDWPEDFGDVELKAEGAYLDTVEGRSQK